MKYLKLITICILTVPLLAISASGETTLEMETFHISPVNRYKSLSFPPRQQIGTLGGACANNGEIFTSMDADSSLAYCKNNTWSYFPGIWNLNHSQDTPPIETVILTDQSSPRSPRLGLGTTTPPLTLSLFDLGGILAKGIEQIPIDTVGHSNFGDILSLVPQEDRPIFWWYPQKGAFRAQYFNLKTDVSGKWTSNDGNTGYYSTAFGNSNVAAGRGSFAAGNLNRALEDLSSITGGENNLIDIADKSPVPDPAAAGAGWRTGSTIAGGSANQIAGTADFIGGGQSNSISGADSSAIGGGYGNAVTGDYSIILGGYQNQNNSDSSMISGGYQNIIESGAAYSSIIGGKNNRIKTGSDHSLILGGESTLTGSGSVLANGGHYPITLTSAGSYLFFTGNHYNYYLANGNGETTIPGGFERKAGTYAVHLLGTLNEQVNAQLVSDFSTVLGVTAPLTYSGGGSGDHSVVVSPSTAPGGDELVNFNKTVNAPYSFSTSGGGIFAYASGSHSVFHGGGIGNSTWSFAPGFSDCSGSFTKANNSFIFSPGNNVIMNWDNDNTYAIFAACSGANVSKGIGIAIGVQGASSLDPSEEQLKVSGKVRSRKFKIGYIPAVGGSALYHDSGTKAVFHNDLAEVFTSIQDVEPGDIVTIHPDGNKLVKSAVPYDPAVIGIVSLMPAVLFEGDQILLPPEAPTQATSRPPVSLAGRVKVKVCTENGPIRRGDLLTTSSIPGTGMKADKTIRAEHAIVAKALEDFNPDGETTGTIVAVIMVR
ncbi:MAG: hypothetical protein AB1650_09650 [Candidatus Omnitrophota bacterium]